MRSKSVRLGAEDQGVSTAGTRAVIGHSATIAAHPAWPRDARDVCKSNMEMELILSSESVACVVCLYVFNTLVIARTVVARYVLRMRQPYVLASTTVRDVSRGIKWSDLFYRILATSNVQYALTAYGPGCVPVRSIMT